MAFSLVTLAGLVFLLRARPAGSMLLITAVVLLPAPYYITHTSLRHRHPLDPVLCLLAVYVVVCAYESVSAPFSKRISKDASRS